MRVEKISRDINEEGLTLNRIKLLMRQLLEMLLLKAVSADIREYQRRLLDLIVNATGIARSDLA